MKNLFLASLLLVSSLALVRADAGLTPGPVIGIGTALRAHDNQPVVASVLPQSPADRAGIKPGDRFERIDDWNVDGQSLVAVASHLRGAIGSRVRVTIMRGTHEKTFAMRRQILLLPGSKLPE